MWTLVIVSQNDGTTFVLLIFDWTCSCLQQDAWQGNTMHIAGTLPRSKVVFEIKSTSKLVIFGYQNEFFPSPQMKQKQPNSWSMWKLSCPLPLERSTLKGHPWLHPCPSGFFVAETDSNKRSNMLKGTNSCLSNWSNKKPFWFFIPKRFFRVFSFSLGENWGRFLHFSDLASIHGLKQPWDRLENLTLEREIPRMPFTTAQFFWVIWFVCAN